MYTVYRKQSLKSTNATVHQHP